MNAQKTYDTKCHELALRFIGEFKLDETTTAKLAHELAIDIQFAIERFLEIKGLQ